MTITDIGLIVFAVTVILLWAFYEIRFARKGVLIDVEEAIEKFGRAVLDDVEANAVRALTEKFSDNPELATNLRVYSRQVVASVLFMRVNALSKDISNATNELTAQRGLYVRGYYDDKSSLAVLEAMLVDLMAELLAADKVVQEFRAEG